VYHTHHLITTQSNYNVSGQRELRVRVTLGEGEADEVSRHVAHLVH